MQKHKDTILLVKKVLHLRRNEPLFRRTSYLKGDEIDSIHVNDQAAVFILKKKYLIAFNSNSAPLQLDEIDFSLWKPEIIVGKAEVNTKLFLGEKSSLIACRSL